MSVVKNKIVLFLVLIFASSVLMTCDDFFNLVQYGGNDVGPSLVKIYNLRYHSYDDSGTEKTVPLEFSNFTVKIKDESTKTYDNGYFTGSDKFSDREATIAAIDDLKSGYANGLFDFTYEFEKHLATGSEAYLTFDFDSMSYNNGISITETALLDDAGQISSTKFTKQDFIDALNPDGNLIKIFKGSDTYIYIEQEDEAGVPKITVEYKSFIQ